MNNQDSVILLKKYGLTQKEIKSVFSMVRTGKYTMDAAAKFIIKGRVK